MNKKFVYQVGNNRKLYYDARPTKYQDNVACLIRHSSPQVVVVTDSTSLRNKTFGFILGVTASYLYTAR
jgi:hypothetical protein